MVRPLHEYTERLEDVFADLPDAGDRRRAISLVLADVVADTALSLAATLDEPKAQGRDFLGTFTVANGIDP